VIEGMSYQEASFTQLVFNLSKTIFLLVPDHELGTIRREANGADHKMIP